MGSGLCRRPWTSLPTPFISAQRLSERTVFSNITILLSVYLTAAYKVEELFAWKACLSIFLGMCLLSSVIDYTVENVFLKRSVIKTLWVSRIDSQ
jgi:threonine/homoserine efflux transporter RhtA